MDATDVPAPSGGRSQFWTWTTLAVFAAFACVYLALVGRDRTLNGTQGPAIGRKLTYLELQPLTGDSKPVALRDLAGRVTLLNFWGTWCPPCQLEFPHLVELAAQLAGERDFRLLAVSCGGEGADVELDPLRAETESFLRSRNSKLPTYADQNADSRRALAISFDLDFGYPTTIILDRQGTIRGFWEGYSNGSEHDMRELIDKLLKEPAAAPTTGS